jgi:hypothetical protein
VGWDRLILRGSANTWSPMTETPPRPLGVVGGLWAAGANDAWATSSVDGILRWTGQGWTHFGGAAAGMAFIDVWGSAADDVWFIDGTNALQHWNGANLTLAVSPSGPIQSLARIVGSSRTSVWAVAANVAYRWDGTQWTAFSNTNPMTNYVADAWSGGSNELWVTYRDGALRHFDGAWTTVTAAPYAIRSIWGTAPGDLWAVGASGARYHFDGQTWTGVTATGTGFKIDLQRVRGTATDDVWAMASGGWATHWNGHAWTDTSSRFVGTLNALAVAPGAGVFAATGGAIVHRGP